MSVPNPRSWQDLFAASGESAARAPISVRPVQRGGRDFLVLPAEGCLAAASLALYAAQTPLARLAKRLLAFALRCRLPVGLPVQSVQVAGDSDFGKFLAQTAATENLPRFAILAGNPNAEGQRFILLLFSSSGKPAAVVKAGMSDAAIALIEHESSFLASVPADTPGIPRVRGTFQSHHVRALALDFIAGRSPGPGDDAELDPLLTSWIDSTRVVAVGSLPAWQRLAESVRPDSPGWRSCRDLADLKCHPVLYHGDFAPWNIKVTKTGWQPLDWERGELASIPGWDWFHYVIQSALLARREPAAELKARVERLLSSEAFTRYAARAKITGAERKLVVAYLNHAIHVIRQTEGLERLRELLGRIAGG